MRKKISFKKRISIFTALFLSLSVGLAVDCKLSFPDRINIFEGESISLGSSSAFILDVPATFGGVLNSDGSVGADGHSRSASALESYTAELKLFGVIPVRSVHVDVHPKTTLVPCGNTIGIKIFTQGLVCVGNSELKSVDGKISNPALEQGIREGDILLSANGIKLETTEQLADVVSHSAGNPIELIIERGGKQFNRKMTPIETSDGCKLGLWVRDSTAGIGTLTFYNEQTNEFGALGHPIADSDTGTLMPVSSGAILNASVFNVKKGVRGEPGELKGIFESSQKELGQIYKNTNQGIYGTLDPSLLTCAQASYPVASRSQITEGAASILSNVDGKTVQEFSIEIQRVMRYNNDNCKDMVIKITDPALLEKTGGIVQGMSGSPILQNGKLIGAVTHVFVNDPTRGYGIFIENMLDEAGKIK